MALYQNILVAIDPNQDDQPALRRAIYLIQRNGGCIKAFLPIYDLSYDMTTLLSPEDRSLMRKGVVNHRTAWISELCRPYTDIKIPIEIKVVWHNRPYEAIIQEILNARHDLLLKMAHQHSRLEFLMFTPVDWHLLRKCPCPVWIVKDKPWPENAKTVVAVNLSSGEKAWHQALNLKLVEKAQELVKYLGNTEIHIISAYPVMPINISVEIADFNSNLYNDAIRAQHLVAIKSLRQKFSMDEKYTHVEKGLPEQVIPALSEQLQAGIVILGTLGRTGISAAMMGNTAENVIDRLKCDLLVIKPDEFVCPVECDMD